METYYKVLNRDGSPYHGGSGNWFLPNGRRGKWMPKIADPAPCRRGYHILKRGMLVQWLGPAIFEVEIRGKTVWQEDKGVAEQARLIRRFENWNEQTARLFACDCAEAAKPTDPCSVNAILVARKFAFGLTGRKELDAAGDAARAAAGDAARAAARAAAGAAARAAAGDAARDAAWDAARAAGWDAAWAAARDVQTKRLFKYLNGTVDLDAIRKRVENA